MKNLYKHRAIIQSQNIVTAKQRKSFNALMTIAKPQIQNGLQEKFKTDLSELKSMISKKRINNEELKQSLEELMDLKLEFNVLENNKWKSWHKMVLVSEISITDTEIIFSFPPTIRDNIINPEVYGIIDMKVNKSLEFKHSIPIYEFCKDYINTNVPRLELEIFKKLLGIEGKYKKPAHFKRDVLDVATKEINEKSDIKIRWEFSYSGRKITHINFWSEKRKKSDSIIEDIEKEDYKSDLEMLIKLIPDSIQDKDRGNTIEKIKLFIQKNGVDYVKYALLYTIDKADINKGFTGYFTKTLQNNWHEKFMNTELKIKDKATPKKITAVQTTFDDLSLIEDLEPADYNYNELSDNEKKYLKKANEITKKNN